MPRSNCTATLRSVVRTKNQVGDATRTTSDTVLTWARIAPRSSQERTDPSTPAVITAATLYGPSGLDVDSDDLFVISDHSPSMDGDWQVEGRAGDWGRGLEVALKRTGSS